MVAMAFKVVAMISEEVNRVLLGGCCDVAGGC